MNVADLFATLRITPSQQSFDAADKLIDGVKSALVGLAAYAGVHALAGMVADTVELGSHINDLSQSTNITTDTLQELGYVAKLNSSDMDGMAAGLVKLQIAMSKAHDGSKEQIESFSKLGVKVTDTHGKLRPVEDVFEDIAINQSKMTDGAKKLDAGVGVMGKGFKNLVPTMNDVAQKGMANVIAEAHELGAVIDSDAIAALDEFGDTTDKVKFSLTGLRNQAVAALIPTLQKLADGFLDWVKANRQLIVSKLQVVLGLMIKALTWVGKAVLFVVDALMFLDKHSTAVKVAVLGLAAAMLIFKAQSIAAAVASGLAWAVANIPLILLAALMMGLILIVDDVITAFQGGDSVLQKFFEERFGVDLVETLTNVAGGIKAAFEAVVDYIVPKIQKIIDDAREAADLVDDIVNGDDSRVNKAARWKFVNNMIGTVAPAATSATELAGTQARLAARIKEDPDFLTRANTAITLGTQIREGDAARALRDVSVQAPITINIDGSKDPSTTRSVVESTLTDFFGDLMRQTASGVGGVR